MSTKVKADKSLTVKEVATQGKDGGNSLEQLAKWSLCKKGAQTIFILGIIMSSLVGSLFLKLLLLPG